MKAFFAMLLLANMLYFAWQYPQQRLLEQGLLMPPEQTFVDDPAIPTLSLIRDVPKQVLAAIPQQAAKTETAVQIQTTTLPQSCFSIGPFSDEGQSDRALKLLTGHNIKGRSQRQERKLLSGYRVQLRFTTRDAAQRTLTTLTSRGIKDIALRLTADGAYVSLGYFSLHDSALRRSADIQSLGYQAEIENVYREKQAYWLELYQGTAAAQLLAVWPEIEREFSDVRREVSQCL